MMAKNEANIAILVVDDDKINRLTLKGFLGYRGYKVDMAGDGNEALALLKGKRYDLILMDIQMPVLDGVKTVQILRRSDEYTEHAATPVIAITAYAMDGDREHFLDSGMDDYLPKPIEAEDLYELVERHLNS